jgi:sugar (pentulose or hexulose) kinase
VEKTTFIGIDLGTSGVRAIAIDSAGKIEAQSNAPLPPSICRDSAIEQEPGLWWQGVETALDSLFTQLDPTTVQAISVDGTSGTVLLADSEAKALSTGVMYNDGRAVAEARHIAQLAPRESAAHGTGSGLAKLLWLLENCDEQPARVHTQADWIATRLGANAGICDANNALKLGYDPQARCWPRWLQQLGLPDGLLPEVVAAGVAIGTVAPELARRWGLREETLIVSGTTDSTAAFIASGASQPGEAVTSLGSTLVLKVIAEKPVFAPQFGVYSQPLGEQWLVGGASNSGGAVLRQFFSDAQMAEMSRQIRPERRLCLEYYPLPAPGERFPINDPGLAPRMSPRPHDDQRFFQGLLEGIARIEKAGYEKLAALGAPYPRSVRSNGGGAANPAWTQIRAQLLGVPMLPAVHSDAAYGAALLAREGASAV